MTLSSKLIFILSAFLFWVNLVQAGSLVLDSTDITQGKLMNESHVFNGFGCKGMNNSPQLSWSNVPENTQAFAITVYDPDAPTGSGWWHWQLVNIPKHITMLPSGTGDVKNNLTPKGSIHTRSDYGFKGFGGACPPEGHGVHRYQFTVHALSKILELPENASSALTGYMIHAHSLGSSTIEALYKR